MLSPFLLSAVQRRLITTPAEAPNLPLSVPTPTLTWPEDTVPSLPYSLGAMCMVNMAGMAKSGTGQTAAVGFPHSRKNLKGNCTAGNVPQQQQHQEHGN